MQYKCLYITIFQTDASPIFEVALTEIFSKEKRE